MAMAISVPLYTVADLENFPDDGQRYEIIFDEALGVAKSSGRGAGRAAHGHACSGPGAYQRDR